MNEEDYVIPIRKYTELGEVTVKECVLKEEYDKLHQRIDKAIEYIEETPIGSILEVHCGEEEEYTQPLLEILKGKSE